MIFPNFQDTGASNVLLRILLLVPLLTYLLSSKFYLCRSRQIMKNNFASSGQGVEFLKQKPITYDYEQILIKITEI